MSSPKLIDVAPGSGRSVAMPPTAVACLRCQALGRRRLLCSKADACEELPHSFLLGPLLLAAWLGTAAAFYLAIR